MLDNGSDDLYPLSYCTVQGTGTTVVGTGTIVQVQFPYLRTVREYSLVQHSYRYQYGT